MSQTKTRKPSPENQVYARALIERLGICRAAKALGLSRLATLNVASGGNCYGSTDQHVTDVRLGRCVT